MPASRLRASQVKRPPMNEHKDSIGDMLPEFYGTFGTPEEGPLAGLQHYCNVWRPGAMGGYRSSAGSAW